MIYKLFISLKRLLLLRRYRKLICPLNGEMDYVKIIDNYCNFIIHMDISKHSYRRLIKYRVSITSANMHALLMKLSHMAYLISRKSHDEVVRVNLMIGRKKYRLDTWLIYGGGNAYADDEALMNIVKQLMPLCSMLNNIRSDDALFKFYMHGFHSHLIDFIEILDVLTAMQLDVINDDRIHNRNKLN